MAISKKEVTELVHEFVVRRNYETSWFVSGGCYEFAVGLGIFIENHGGRVTYWSYGNEEEKFVHVCVEYKGRYYDVGNSGNLSDISGLGDFYFQTDTEPVWTKVSAREMPFRMADGKGQAEEFEELWQDMNESYSNSVRGLIESREPISSVVQQLLEGFKYHSTQVNLPPEDFKELWDKIEEEDVYTDPDSDRTYGIEKEPHVTILYGLTENKPKEMAKLLSDFGPIKLKLGKMSLFENEKYDVLKFDVESDDLHKLNTVIKDNFEYETDYPEYNPHLTIAYIKKGKGKKYVDNRSNKFKDVVFEYDAFLFSDKDNKKTVIPLK